MKTIQKAILAILMLMVGFVALYTGAMTGLFSITGMWNEEKPLMLGYLITFLISLSCSGYLIYVAFWKGKLI